MLDESKLADNIAKFLLPITLGGAARSRARSDLIQIDNTYDLDGQVVRNYLFKKSLITYKRINYF